MIRSELIARIAAQNPHLYLREVEATVDALLDCLETALASGRRIGLRGFGTFEVQHLPARTRRNPRSGASVKVDAGARVVFKASKAMCARLNRPGC